ncbi:MAG: hypothetical protein ACKOZT_12140 [Cyanobium sp.]
MRRFSVLAAALLLLPPGDALALQFSPAPQGAHAGEAASGLAAPANAQTLLLARGGGRGGGGGGGRAAAAGRAPRANTGMDRAPRSFDRGNSAPSGGWSRNVVDRPNRARPSLESAAARPQPATRAAFAGGDRMAGVNREGLQNRAGSLNRDDWDRAGERLQNGRDIRQDNLSNARDNWNDNRGTLNNRLNQAADRYNNYWPGWARPGWNLARPWNWGWYGGWVNPPWGWWTARSVAWGLTSLASAAVINDAVNSAIAVNQTLIVVPQSSYQLYYNSVEPSGDQTISFVAVPAGGEALSFTADCRGGSLNGYQPAGAAEAELLNAACQVAFGS